MDLIGAIDLLDGAAVRLVQGDYARRAATVADPESTVRDWVREGMRWLHLVDLDGARTGRPVNLAAAGGLAAAARAVAPGVRVELGGGLRRVEDVAAALEAGPDVVVLGTAAVEDPALLIETAGRWPGRVAASLDLRDGRVALDGWTRERDADPIALAASLVAAGAAHLVVTDTRRDGTRRGPNVELLGAMRSALAGTRLVAAGGIGSVEDLRALAAIGVDGAVVGLALVDGSLPVRDAIAAVTRPAEVG